MTHLKSLAATLGAAAVLTAFAACGGNQSTAPSVVTTPVPNSANTLQAGIGTATIATLGGSTLGLNVVTAFRQSNGQSGTLVNLPSITGPFTVPPGANGAYSDGGTNHISSFLCPANGTGFSPATATTFTTTCSTTVYNANGLAVGYDIVPDDPGIFSVAGTQQFNYYPQPFYVSAPLQTAEVGGPPAFTLATGAVSTFSGYEEGVQTFAVTGVQSGAYTVAVALPTATPSPAATATAAATPTVYTQTVNVNVAKVVGLVTTGVAGPVTSSSQQNAQPVVPCVASTTVCLTLDGKGGASVAVSALPAGATEMYVNIDNITGNCHATKGDQKFTLHVSAAGTATLADNLGNGSTATPTICTAAQNGGKGDDFRISALAVDYGAYAAAYGNATATAAQTQLPFASSAFQADASISYPNDAESQ